MKKQPESISTIDSRLAYGYLKSLAFVRRTGTPEEKKAARIISGHLKKMRLKPRLEPFDIDMFTEGKASLEVTAPYKKKYKAWPIGYSKSTPKNGITAPLVYLENITETVLRKQKGKAIITDVGAVAKDYKTLIDSGVKARIKICPPGKDTYYKFLYMAVKEYGKMPGVSISYEDGLEIVRRGATRCRIKSSTTTKKAKSQNVIAEIKGTNLPEEIIVVGAHYDSVPWSDGAIDNASGSALALALAAHFAKKPLARTLRFVWFGAEEIGLVGSFEYVRKHARELKKIKFNLNIDVGGTVVGQVVPRVTGSDELTTYVGIMGKELGTHTRTISGVYSSDSAPFAEKGVQALNLSRYGGATTYIHTAGDRLKHSGPGAFDKIGLFGAEFLRRIGNAVEFPFTGGLPSKLQKELKKYLEARGRKFKYRENK